MKTPRPLFSAGVVEPRNDDAVAVARFGLWGTSIAVVVHPAPLLEDACDLVRHELALTDRACNRFRPDAEIVTVNQAAGRPVAVSPTLYEALAEALRGARVTGGALDPTVGGALVDLGYDRDIDELSFDEHREVCSRPAPGWRGVSLDPARATVTARPGTAFDLGSVAKALCADRAAERVAKETGAGALVSLGGDVAVAGPPPEGGWVVAVVADARAEGAEAECAVTVTDGALASSSTSGRTWRRGSRQLHHIVDPTTGWPAAPCWRLVTVAASTCVDANIASTAAIVWGPSAPDRLAALGLPARLVGEDWSVTAVGGWPEELPR